VLTQATAHKSGDLLPQHGAKTVLVMHSHDETSFQAHQLRNSSVIPLSSAQTQ
jgi:hypothetical protein